MYSSVHSIPVSNDMFLSSATAASTPNSNEPPFPSLFHHHNGEFNSFENSLSNHQYEEIYASHSLISDKPNTTSRASNRSSSLSSHSDHQPETNNAYSDHSSTQTSKHPHNPSEQAIWNPAAHNSVGAYGVNESSSMPNASLGMMDLRAFHTSPLPNANHPIHNIQQLGSTDPVNPVAGSSMYTLPNISTLAGIPNPAIRQTFSLPYSFPSSVPPPSLSSISGGPSSRDITIPPPVTFSPGNLGHHHAHPPPSSGGIVPPVSPVSASMFSLNSCDTASCLYTRPPTGPFRGNDNQSVAAAAAASFFGHRFLPPSCLTDDSLPTYPNAAAAPNRLPAHKPVRLTQPKHPLAPPNIPVYFKYGEEHYPEETVPQEYTFTEADGTICRYITNFLVYNKRGERLLPIEVLDQPRHAALVLYGSLLPAAAMCRSSNLNLASNNSHVEYGNMRGRKRLNSMINSNGNNEYVNGGLHSQQGGSAGLSLSSNGSSVSFTRKDDCNTYWKNLQCYPVRVELAEWCIDYGQEPSNVPFIWLISRWDVYYRLEKPAGRYSSTFASAKMKFEVSTRIIKTLQHRPDTSFKTLIDLLTAATRHEKQKKKKAQFLKASNKKDDAAAASVAAYNSGNLCNDDEIEKQLAENSIKKKQRSVANKQYSLSTAQGTGVLIDDDSGKPQALTPWGAPYAVEKFKESLLLNLAEFLESQLRNFMEGVGSNGSAESAAGTNGGPRRSMCYNLLATPFMRVLRERTAARMEILQLIEAKRRALEVAKSLTEYPNSVAPTQLTSAAASAAAPNMLTGVSEAAMVSPYGCYAAAAGNSNGLYGMSNNIYGSGTSEYLYPSMSVPPSHENISMLEMEVQQLQQMLLDDSDAEDDKSSNVPRVGNEDSDECHKSHTDSNSSAIADEDPDESHGCCLLPNQVAPATTTATASLLSQQQLQQQLPPASSLQLNFYGSRLRQSCSSSMASNNTFPSTSSLPPTASGNSEPSYFMPGASQYNYANMIRCAGSSVSFENPAMHPSTQQLHFGLSDDAPSSLLLQNSSPSQKRSKPSTSSPCCKFQPNEITDTDASTSAHHQYTTAAYNAESKHSPFMSSSFPSSSSIFLPPTLPPSSSTTATTTTTTTSSSNQQNWSVFPPTDSSFLACNIDSLDDAHSNYYYENC